MTVPTKAICPVLLEDYRKITVERKGVLGFFTSEHIRDCMAKVTTVNVGEELQVGPGIVVVAHYAGHVLGAAMFEVRVGKQSVLYTGREGASERAARERPHAAPRRALQAEVCLSLSGLGL